MSWVGIWFGQGLGGGKAKPFTVIDTGALVWVAPTAASAYVPNVEANVAYTIPITSAILHEGQQGVIVMGNAVQVYSGNDWPIQVTLEKALTPNTPPLPANVSTATRIGYGLVQEQSKIVTIPTQLADPLAVGASWATGVVLCPFARSLTTITPGNYSLEIIVEMNDEQTTWTRVPVVVKQALVALA